jgi:hypothetical protein
MIAICSQEYEFFTKYLMSYARILVFFNFGVAIKKKVILLIFKLDSKSLERSIGDVHTIMGLWNPLDSTYKGKEKCTIDSK